jgi:hydroxypyruvate isomerase
MRFSASITTMFRELEPLRRPGAAKAAGFSGIEIQRFEADPHALARATAEAEIAVALINADMGDFFAGGPGLSGVPGREAAFAEAMTHAIEAAQILDCALIHAGPSRLPAGTARADALRVYRDNLLKAAEETRKAGLTLLIEPINRTDTPTAVLADIGEAAALIRGPLENRVGLLFDLYHVAQSGKTSGADILASFASVRDLVRHIQFSDIPGRCEPGAGTLDFPALFAAIEASGYRGWLGAEYTPSKPTPETLGWLTTTSPQFRHGPP